MFSFFNKESLIESFERSIKEGNYLTNKPKLLNRAKKEDNHIINQIAFKFLYGREYEEPKIKKNIQEAKEWLNIAANKGDASSIYDLGIIALEEDEASSEAERLILEAAEKGHSDAVMFLGWMYRDGYGVEKNMKKALFWLQKASNLNVDLSQFALAEIYDKGIDVPQNKDEAIRLYKLSTHGKLSCSDGYYRLIEKTLAGDVLERNEIIAYERLTTFVKHTPSHYTAAFKLAELLENGIGCEINKKKAAQYYLIVAAGGVDQEYSKYPLGRRYETDKTPPFIEAMYKVAIKYQNGEGFLQDYIKSLTWHIILSAKDNKYADVRDDLSSKMSPEAIIESQRKAHQFINEDNIWSSELLLDRFDTVELKSKVFKHDKHDTNLCWPD